MMTSVIYIVPYFGKMRDDFCLWLKTCAYNPTIHWLLITDDHTIYQYPHNVKVIYMEFDEIVDKIAALVDFPISLKTPHKLCEYKPTYGEVFSEYIFQYDFWGYCDMDMLWGNIRHFLTENIFKEYDKIGFLGHSTLYRNTPEVNKRWRCQNCSEIDYKEAFSSEENFFFDERAMNQIYEANGWKIYKKQIFADLTEYHYNFYLTNVPDKEAIKNKRQIFFWEKGKLSRMYLLKKQVDIDEFMYIHFLKRKMQIDNDIKKDKWMIIPNKITTKLEKPTYKMIKRHSKPRWGKYFIQLFFEKKEKITPANIVRFIIRRSRKYYALKYKNGNLNDNKM